VAGTAILNAVSRFCHGLEKMGRIIQPVPATGFFSSGGFSEDSNKQAVIRLKKTLIKSLSEYIINDPIQRGAWLKLQHFDRLKSGIYSPSQRQRRAMRNWTTFCPIWQCPIEGSGRCPATCYEARASGMIWNTHVPFDNHL